MTFDQQDGERLIAPYKDRVREVLRGAEADFDSNFAPASYLLGPGAIAAIRQNLMVRKMISVFASVSDIQPKVYRQRAMLVHPEFMLRFNKMDKSLRVRRNKTRQSAALAGQLEMEFDGMPAARPYLAAGYTLDDLGVEIKSTQITLQEGRQVVWSISLDEGEAATGFATLRPNQPSPQSPVTKKPRVKRDPANNDKAEAANDDGDVRGASTG